MSMAQESNVCAFLLFGAGNLSYCYDHLKRKISYL